MQYKCNWILSKKPKSIEIISSGISWKDFFWRRFKNSLSWNDFVLWYLSVFRQSSKKSLVNNSIYFGQYQSNGANTKSKICLILAFVQRLIVCILNYKYNIKLYESFHLSLPDSYRIHLSRNIKYISENICI